MLIRIEPAVPDESDHVFSVLDEAAAWLQSQGIKQWPARFSGVDDWRAERINAHIEAGHVWGVRIRDEIAAVVTLAGPDPDYAHGWPTDPDDALYVYRMAARRKHAGHGLGKHILNWASTRAAALGLSWLRLDCHRDNEPLQRYYERAGFERVGTVVTNIDPGGSRPSGETYTRGSGALYQRASGTVQIGSDDPYDPTGEAAVWQAAASLVNSVKSDDVGSVVDPWNTAIEQASRVLDNEARGVRQRNGVWYRVISGRTS